MKTSTLADSAAGTALSALLLAALASGASAQTPQFQETGNHPGDALGASVARLSDVDGDTVDDFVVGAPAADGSPSAPGYALVLSGADGRAIHRLLTTGDADLFGWSVADVGDSNDDGVADVLVGEPGSAPIDGEARLFSGLTGDLLRTLDGGSSDSWDGFGYAVAGIGDVNADGHPDFIVGQPSLSGEGPGAARVYDGFGGGLLYTLTGLAPGDGFGAAVAGAGLIDDDAVPDVIVGSLDGAYARVHSGATGALLHHFAGFGAGYGASVAGLGDFDHDGTDDVGIGAATFNTVDVMSGATGLLLRRFDALGGSFGASFAPLGDVDGDGTTDLLIGSPDDTLLEIDSCGSALVVSGQTGGHLFKFFGNMASEHAGASVASLGDTDGDGLPELLLGTPGDVFPLPDTHVGSVKTYSGKLSSAFKTYGFGCPNSFLITPAIELLGDPLPGGDLILSLTRLFPGTFAVVFIGLGPGFAPLSNGCILWVAPVLPAKLVFPLGDFPFGADTATAAGHIPPAVPAGFTVTFQTFVLDEFADGGFATSSAVQLTVQ